jgi:hypothetical protein
VCKKDSILIKLTGLVVFFLISLRVAWTHDINSFAVDHHGHWSARIPVGVMGEHTHNAGEWMFSYRFMFMSMDGIRNGTDDLSTDEVLGNFMEAPLDMDVEVHMFGIMFAPTDNLTLMGMIPYVRKTMNHVTRDGSRFKTKSEGIGDIRLTALYKFFDRGGHRLHFNGGISLPSGSIDEKDTTPAGKDQQLPYPMQNGSGTVDLLPGVTYLGQYGEWSWGAQIAGTIRLGKNDRDYRLGNRLDSTLWGARNWFNWFSTSLRFRYQVWGNIKGEDPVLNPQMVPTADPDRQGGSRVDSLFGINFYVPKGPRLIRGQRLAVEVGFPIYQNLDGPQLETDWNITFGWQYAWSF